MPIAARLRENKEAILHEWLEAVRTLPSAEGLSVPTLRDHVPELLEVVAQTLEQGGLAGDGGDHAAQQHAQQRHRHGFNLRQVVIEYQALRQILIRRLCDTQPRPPIADILLMHDVLDHAVGEAMTRYASESDRVRDTFVGVLGHDLRAPLSAIALNAERIRQMNDGGDARLAHAASRIAAGASRMDRMISDLLDFTRGQLGGGIRIDPEQIDLQPLIQQTVEELALAHPDRSIQCVTTQDDLCGLWDPDRLAQAVSNLVANALQHGRDPIIIAPAAQAQHVTIVVRNDGEIDPAARRGLFDPFTRGRSAYAGGLGLGLYIVCEIAKAHGGSIDVESAGGQTSFRVVLPRRAHRPSCHPRAATDG